MFSLEWSSSIEPALSQENRSAIQVKATAPNEQLFNEVVCPSVIGIEQRDDCLHTVIVSF